jgi:hypothetical protein
MAGGMNSPRSPRRSLDRSPPISPAAARRGSQGRGLIDIGTQTYAFAIRLHIHKHLYMVTISGLKHLTNRFCFMYACIHV